MSASPAPSGSAGRVVAVVGGHGKTGKAVASSLSARGVAARRVGRGEWGRLEQVLAGCESVYVIAPNLHPDEPAYVSEVVAAARAAGLTRLVYHSVAAPYAPSMPHHVGKAVSEDLVRRSGLAWTVLQPCAYVQNFVPGLREERPRLEVPYDVDALFGLVDLVDVGEAAATVLLDDGHHGSTFELGGPRLVSVREVASAAETVLGRTVPVERLDLDTWSSAVDLEPPVRDGLRAMFEYYDRHGLPAGPLPLTALLGRAPTGLVDTLRREVPGS